MRSSGSSTGCTTGAQNLLSVTFEQGIPEIPEYAIYNSSSISTVTIPDSVNRIGTRAFEGFKGTFILDSVDSFSSIYAIDNEIKYTARIAGIADTIDRYLARNSTAYHTSISTTTTSGYVNMNIKYDFKEEAKQYISNMQLKIKIPSTSILIVNTFKLNGKSIDAVADESGYIYIPLNQTSGNVSFAVMPMSGSDYLLSYAQIIYSYSGISKTEIIGIVNMGEELLTIELPDETSSNTFTVSGITTPERIVTVSLDGVNVGSVASSKTGRYGLIITLDNPQQGDLFKVESKITSNSIETKVASFITYRQDAIEMQECNMYFRNKVYDLLSLSDARPVITWAGNSSFTFVVKFNEEAKLDEVNIISTKSDGIVKLSANWDPKKKAYVATGFYNYVPGVISVEYTKDELNAFRETSVSLQTSYDDANSDLVGYQSKVMFDDSTEFYYLREYEPNVTFSYTGSYGRTTYEGRNCYIVYDPIYLMRENIGYACQEIYIYQDNGLYTLLRTGIGTAEGQNTAQQNMRFSSSSKILGDSNDSSDLKDVYEETQKLLNVLTDLPERHQEDTVYVALNNYIETAMDAVERGSAEYWELTSIKAKLEMYDLVSKQNSVFSEINKYISKSYSISDDPNFLIGKLDVILKKKLEKEMENTVKAMNKASKNISNDLLRDIINQLSKRGFKGESLIERIEKEIAKKAIYFNPKYAIDPSGYVYEAVDSNRLLDVKTTIYYKESDNGSPIVWDATEYDQENPLYTDALGAYAWDVPEGLWQVKYELAGYETTYSDWMPVPPPQVDVNVGMKSLVAPTVVNVAAYPEAVEITFSKYMKISSLNGEVAVAQNGSLISGSIQAQNAENGFASIFRFLPSEELTSTSVNVGISANVESYAGVKISSAYNQVVSVSLEPKTINASGINVDFDSEGANIKVQISPAAAASGKTILAFSNDPNIATVAASAIVNTDGTAYIHVSPQLPGIIKVALSLSGSSLYTEVEVSIGFKENSTDDNEIVYGDVDSNGEVSRADLARLRQYFAGWAVTINELAADVNANGIFDRADLARLRQYFAGWPVTLGKDS
jgi:hypothetical protein